MEVILFTILYVQQKYRRVVFDKNVDEHLRQIFVECPEVKKKNCGAGSFEPTDILWRMLEKTKVNL